MRYILTRTLDMMPEGTDVTDVYRADVLERLVDEGYVTEVPDDEPDEDDVDEETE